MKKILFLISAIAIFCGCQQVEEIDQPVHGEVSSFKLPEVIYASMEGQADDTRTYVDEDGHTILWHNGDEISFFYAGYYNSPAVNSSETGASIAKFYLDPAYYDNDVTFIDSPKLVYPYNESTALIKNGDVETLVVSYPTEQTYTPNSFGKGANIMVATVDDFSEDVEQVYFRNACGYFIIKLNGEGAKVKSIKLSAKGDVKIAGKAHIVASEYAAPKVTMTDEATSTVTLICDKVVTLGAEDTEFWFALPPVTFEEGLEVVITDDLGNKVFKSTNREIVVARNEIQPMAAINVKAQTSTLMYTRASSTEPLSFVDGAFSSVIKSHTYNDQLGAFVIDFDMPLTTIGVGAFKDSDITSITMPTNVTDIKEQAFMNCANLESVILPTSLLTIGNECFRGCSKLNEITLPDGLTTIGVSALRGTAVTKLTFPGSINRIGVNCFYECSNLSSVSFLPSANSTPMQIGCIDPGTLSYNMGTFATSPINIIDINRQLECINSSDKLCNNCGVFQQSYESNPITYPAGAIVTIGEQLETIGDLMFAGINIYELNIPNTVSTINDDAFANCVKLERITIEAGDTTLVLKHYFTNLTQPNACAPFANSPLKYISVSRNIAFKQPDGTDIGPTTVGTGPFAMNNQLTPDYETTVVLGSQVTTYTSSMFAYRPVKTLTIPGTVNVVQENGFANMLALEEISFEPSPTGEKLVLGHNIYSYGNIFDNVHGSFESSANLKKVTLNRDITYTLTTAPGEDDAIFSMRKQLNTVILGEQVTTIIDWMFHNSSISHIEIPASVTSIGKRAFENCDKLTAVTVPSSVKSIGEYALYDCDGLTSATINSKVMGSNMFDDCDNLSTITIGGIVPSIDNGMFDGCKKLSTLNITGSVDTIGNGTFDGFNITSINISGHVGTIGDNAFDDCDNLVTLNITGTINTIGKSAFDDSDELSTVNIACTVDTIGAYAFSDCDGITEIAIRANKVEDYAFEDMDGLMKATLYGETVGKGVFYDSDALEDITIDGGVNSIGMDAFYSCPSIKKVTFLPSPTNTDLLMSHQTFATGIESPFWDSNELVEIDWNRNISYTLYNSGKLDTYNRGLFVTNARTLKTVTIGEQVKVILPYTFAHSAIESITIPANVEVIGDYSFAYCKELTTVRYKGTPEIGTGVYEGCNNVAEISPITPLY